MHLQIRLRNSGETPTYAAMSLILKMWVGRGIIDTSPQQLNWTTVLFALAAAWSDFPKAHRISYQTWLLKSINSLCDIRSTTVCSSASISKVDLVILWKLARCDIQWFSVANWRMWYTRHHQYKRTTKSRYWHVSPRCNANYFLRKRCGWNFALTRSFSSLFNGIR